MALSLLDANDRPGEHAPSWYAATANQFQTLPAAKGEMIFDVAIVGGGYSGLSAALHLSQAGYNVGVFEAHRVGWGASGRNGGQVGTGQRLEQIELEELVGEALGRKAFQIGYEATTLVRHLVKTHAIDCAFRDGTIGANHKKQYNDDTKREVEHLREFCGHDKIRYLNEIEIREKVGSQDYHGGEVDMHAGHLHPLDYARGLAGAALKAGAQIFETSRVEAVTGGIPCRLQTRHCDVTATYILLAANGYLGSLDGNVADRVMPINNYIIATEPLDDEACRSLIRDGEAVYDSRFVVNYFRISEDRRLLFGGGETYSYRFPRDIAKLVRRPMLKIFPQLSDVRIDHAWGGTLAITMNRLPHFEFRDDGIINISGYSGSGIHMATMAGKLVAEAISGQMERFDIMSKLPSPRFPGGAVLRWPLLPLALSWYALRDRL